MYYKAMRNCRFGGVDYYVGSTIPNDVIPPYAAGKLLKQGILVEIDNILNVLNKDTAELIQFPIRFPVLTGGEIEYHDVSAESLEKALVIVQCTSADAVTEIEDCVDRDVLLMINALDSRKAVKSAASKKIEEIPDNIGDK